LVEGNKSAASEMEDYLETFASEKGIGKGMLMQPLRWVVSGQAGGPPIFKMLALIGLAEITKRLEVVNEKFQ
jgi:glutamyl/glutaminyl-tRNA synthetase